ncbi:MAG: hypothetical protein IJ658_03970, partial [Kiritimatiellae bacterium]|nr:hypothetical protein [Kiritimatiellia bacterium]
MKRKTRVLLAVVTASFAASVLSETIVAYPNEKNSGVTVNGEKVGDAKYGDGWTFMNGVLALNVARDYTLAGTNTKGVVRIDVNANATVTLDSLRIKTAVGKKHGAFVLKDGVEVKLYLKGESELESGETYAGITVPKKAVLEIYGPGLLLATGGKY